MSFLRLLPEYLRLGFNIGLDEQLGQHACARPALTSAFRSCSTICSHGTVWVSMEVMVGLLVGELKGFTVGLSKASRSKKLE